MRLKQEVLSLSAFPFGYTVGGVTLDTLGIVWASGVRKLTIWNRSAANVVYITSNGDAPTTASFSLGAGDKVEMYGTMPTFKKLKLSAAEGKTVTTNVQQCSMITSIM